MKRKSIADREAGISFRLDGDEMLKLNERAERLGVSRHQLGREYTRQVLWAEADRTQFVEAMNILRAAINELRADVAISVESLLILGGHTEKQARDWVQSQFKIP